MIRSFPGEFVFGLAVTDVSQTNRAVCCSMEGTALGPEFDFKDEPAAGAFAGCVLEAVRLEAKQRAADGAKLAEQLESLAGRYPDQLLYVMDLRSKDRNEVYLQLGAVLDALDDGIRVGGYFLPPQLQKEDISWYRSLAENRILLTINAIETKGVDEG